MELNILLLQAELPFFWDIIVNQAFPLLLLAIAVWWFNKKNQGLQTKVDDLYSYLMDDYQKDKDKMMNVIDKNTSLYEKLITVLEKKH